MVKDINVNCSGVINSKETVANMKFSEIIRSKIKELRLISDGENGSKYMQYLAAISASFSAFSTGTVIGWSSQISHQLLEGEYGFPITQDQLGWIGSLTSLGAAIFSLFVGSLCDFFGRKSTKLLMCVPLILGWGLMAWAENVEMLYAGRFLTGMIGGAFLVTAPLYCDEISQKEVRGSLGSLTQLMISFGLLFDALLGKFVEMRTYTIYCFIVPFVFIIFFLFMPETPVYYLKKNQEEKAKKVMILLNRKPEEIEKEIIEIKEQLSNEAKRNLKETIKEAIRDRVVKMAFFITFGLMFFRFLCGIDCITAYTSYIFKSVSETFDPQIAPIILVSLQIVFGIVQSAIVDKIGRRILLIFSQLAIALSLAAVGTCLLLNNRDLVSESVIEIIHYIPLIALCVFYIGFAVGLAPIPLMLNTEINPRRSKSLVTSFNTFFGWLLAFALVKTFLVIDKSVGPEVAFFMYAVISLAGVFFTVFFVPETKGKSSEEIQLILSKR